MTSPRSDAAYNYWREASDKFDYYVTGLTGALAAYIGQALRPVPLGLNPQTIELIALALLVVSVVAGFRRIEMVVHIFQLQAQQLYAQEVTGSSLAATKHPMSINVATGELFTPKKLARRAQAHADATSKLEPLIQSTIKRSTTYYKVRNYTLLIGFAILVVARILPAYMS